MNELLVMLVSVLLSAGGIHAGKQIIRIPDDPEPPAQPSYTPAPVNHPPSEPSSGTADFEDGLSWICYDQDGDALSFDVFFSNTDSDPVYVGTVTDAAFSWPAGISLRSGDYHWRVVVRDDEGSETDGSLWSFTVTSSGEILAGTLHTSAVSIWEEVSVSTHPALSIIEGPIPGMEFVVIPSGDFRMGSPSSEPDRGDSEGPRHTVTIDSFELMTTEVTQGMWTAVLGSHPSHDYGVGYNYPVYNVSWDDCQEFINELNYLYSDYEYRLPSESEWEYACRAGTITPYYWGDNSESVMGSYCWYTSNSNSGTHSVAQKLPNSWGLYDMSGNVWEWCEDTWHSDYNGAPADGSAWVSSGASSRVGRGGGWYNNARYCRSAYRHNYSADYRFHIMGFRLARSVR